MLLQGIFVPLSTPFYRDGRPYWRKLEANVGRYGLTPVSGLMALPPAGESSALTDSEERETLRVVAESARPEKVLLAGARKGSVAAALEFAGHAAEAGFDALVLAAPPDWPHLLRHGDARALQLFFSAVADRSPLPVVLWSDAAAPSLQLPPSGIGELARHPNILGLADADLDAERLQAIVAATEGIRREVTVTTVFEAVTGRMLRAEEAEAAPSGPSTFVSAESLSGGAAVAVAPPVPARPALKTRTRTVGFQLMATGSTAGLVRQMTAGVPAFLPTLATCTPQACHEAYAAMKDGDPALAQLKADRLPVADALVAELGAAGVKYACDLSAYFGGQPRLPVLPLSAEDRARVEQAFRELRN